MVLWERGEKERLDKGPQSDWTPGFASLTPALLAAEMSLAP